MATQFLSTPPMPAVARIMSRFDRAKLEGFIAVAIELLDTLDGPDDAEPDDDAKGDVSWSEWHTRGRRKVVDRVTGSHEPMARADGAGMAHEDDEDDDPAEEDGEDRCRAGDDDPTDWARWSDHYADGSLAGELARDNPDSEPNGDEGDYTDADAGLCPTFGIDQTEGVSEGEAFHDLNGIPLIRVPLPENDQ